MNNKKPTRLLACLTVLATALAGAVQAAEAPPSVVLETFACSYNDGKDLGDMLSARDYMVRQADKAGVTLADSYLWSRHKGGSPAIDTVWFSVHDDMNAYAAEGEAFRNAPELDGVQARFDSVGPCDSNVGIASPIHQGKDAGPPGGDSFIASNACMLRPGMGQEALTDLANHVGFTLGNLDAYNSTTIIMANPVTSGPDSADVYIFGINESEAAWAANMGGLQSAPGGAQLIRRFERTLDCSTSLWFSQQVVGGDG